MVPRIVSDAFTTNVSVLPETLVSRWISAYPGADSISPAGWMVAEIKDWCAENLTDHIEKKTSEPDAPLVVYFVSEEERETFIRRWCER